jgi:DNA-binding transcriptional MerR regulator
MPRLTIGAFASRSGLSVSALRFYDRAGVLIPSNVDPASGYRIYEVHQLETATLIRDLRRLEMPLATIQTFLAADPETRNNTLADHLEEMTARVRKAQDLATQLRARLTQPEGQNPMTTMIVDAEALAEAIDQVTPAASSDPELPLLQTVLLEAREGSLRLVATDRYRLAVRDLVARGGEDASFRAVVARAALERIRTTLADKGPVEVTKHDHRVVVGPDETAGQMLAMSAEFPPYEKLFVLDPDAHSVIADRAALEQLLAEDVGKDLLRIRLLNGRLQLGVDGEPPRELAVTYEGPELTVGLHPAFAHYAVSSAVGPDVMIDITEPIRPVVFRSATDSSYICLVMPVKLQN